MGAWSIWQSALKNVGHEQLKLKIEASLLHPTLLLSSPHTPRDIQPLSTYQQYYVSCPRIPSQMLSRSNFVKPGPLTNLFPPTFLLYLSLTILSPSVHISPPTALILPFPFHNPARVLSLHIVFPQTTVISFLPKMSTTIKTKTL